MTESADNAPASWALILDDSATSLRGEAARVWGLTSLERLQRALSRAGIEQVAVSDASKSSAAPRAGSGLVLRGDFFYDERLITGMRDGPARVLEDETGRAVAAHLGASSSQELLDATLAILASRPAVAGLASALGALPRVAPTEVAPAYNAALRKFDPPFLYRAEPDKVRETENRIFASSYKGITDAITKWVFPLPARAVTRVLARRHVKPNTVTAISYVLTGLAGWAFFEGWFAVGLAAAWLMTFLDTVDGKLARVTLTSSPIGNVLDHGLDLVHPPFWWWAWAYGLATPGMGLSEYATAMWVIVGGYVVGRLLEGVFLLAFKQEIFTWRPFDAFFRSIIARRNPNLVILTVGVAAGAAADAYLAVAWWTVICIGIHVVRIAQAFAIRQQGIAIVPWYELEARGTEPEA